MKEVILVISRERPIEKYTDQLKIFTDPINAVKYAKERGYGRNGMSIPLDPNRLETGMMYLTECDDQYVKLIKLKIEDSNEGR